MFDDVTVDDMYDKHLFGLHLLSHEGAAGVAMKCDHLT